MEMAIRTSMRVKACSLLQFSILFGFIRNMYDFSPS
jgi:hypothetical protein